MKKPFEEYRGLRRENYVLFFGKVVTSLGSMVWPMTTMILSQKLGMDAGTIASVLMLVSIVSIPLGLLGGKLADHFSKKKVIVVCDLISVSGYIICAIRKLDFFSMVLFAAAALLQQLESPSYSALVADITYPKDRERAYSLNYLGMNLGMMLAPTIGGLLFKNHLNLAFLINGVSIGSSTLLIWFFLKNTERVSDESSVYEKAMEQSSTWQVLKNNRLILLYILITAIAYAVYCQYSYLMPLDMGIVHGEDGAAIFGTLSSLNCIVVVIFTPLITRYFQKVRECGKMIIGQALVVLGYILFRGNLGTVPLYYVSILLFTWGEIFHTLSTDPYLTRRIPENFRGRIMSVSAAVSALLYALSEPLVRNTYHPPGSRAAWRTVILAGVAGVILTGILDVLDHRRYPDLYH